MINYSNGITTGGSNLLNFNPRDAIELVSWTDDAGTHARIFGHNEKDDALVGVPADARRASFSSAAVVERLLKAGDILGMIESAHAGHPDCAVILSGPQEVAVRRALRNVGGNLFPMPSNPTYSGRAMRPPAWGNAAILCDLADAPILGEWAGTTLIAEHVAEQHRVSRVGRDAGDKAAADTSRVRSEFEKIVSTLSFISGSADASDAVRVAAAEGLGRIGAALAAR